MKISEIQSAAEALLFAVGEPIEISRMSSVLEVDETTLTKIIETLRDDYSFNRRGIRIVKLDGAYQMCSAPNYADYVRKAMETRKPPKLSQSLLEVLSVVAYRQPVTRAYVEQVRGVDCTYSISSLLDKGLIKEAGRLDVPGKPILYRTTKDFLRVFGLESLNELPELPDFAEEENSQVTFKEIESSETQASE